MAHLRIRLILRRQFESFTLRPQLESLNFSADFYVVSDCTKI